MLHSGTTHSQRKLCMLFSCTLEILVLGTVDIYCNRTNDRDTQNISVCNIVYFNTLRCSILCPQNWFEVVLFDILCLVFSHSRHYNLSCGHHIQFTYRWVILGCITTFTSTLSYQNPKQNIIYEQSLPNNIYHGKYEVSISTITHTHKLTFNTH